MILFASDADGDGRLDRQEFQIFQEKQYAYSRRNGSYVPPPDGMDDRFYAVYNALTGGEEGFKLNQYLVLYGRYLEILIRNYRNDLYNPDGDEDEYWIKALQ